MIAIKAKPLSGWKVVVRWLITGFLGLMLPVGTWQLGSPIALGQPPDSVGSQLSQGTFDASGPALIQAVETQLVEAIASCEQSVVAITRIRSDRAPSGPLDSLRSLPSLQLSNEPTSEDFIPSFFGSGIIVSEDGYIATCAHVLDDPRKHNYYVWLDRRCYPASVVGQPAQVQATDPFTDLAVIKIEASGLKTIPRAADPPRKGQLVISLGNPHSIARDGQACASWGMISNVNRFAPKEREQSPHESIHQMGTLLHTDLRSPIGTSGGALINWRGQLVGMTTNFVAGSGYEQPAGLAIATDEFFERIVEVLKQGKQPAFGFLGIQPENLRANELQRGLSGARVSMVIPGLPGSRAGLREGDIIFQVGDNPISSRNDLFRELSRVPTGTKTQLMIKRLKAGDWQVMNLEAELTKKYLATNRPAFSLHGPPVWRGMQVEYSSAIAGELERIAVVRENTKVVIMSVVPDSPTWRAGLRSGYGIVNFNGHIIDSPDQFNDLASRATGRVTLSAIATDGKRLTVTVEPVTEQISDNSKEP